MNYCIQVKEKLLGLQSCYQTMIHCKWHHENPKYWLYFI